MLLPDGSRNLWDAANLLLQKTPARAFTATCEVDASHLHFGTRAGLVVMGLDYSYLVVRRTSDGLRLVRATCRDADQGREEFFEATAACPADRVQLRVDVADGGVCTFSYRSGESPWTAIGEPFQAREGKWIGAKVGLFCTATSDASGERFLDVDWFRITAPASP